MIRLCGIAILTAVLTVLLKELKPEFAGLVSLGGAVLLLASGLSMLLAEKSEFFALFSSVNEEYASVLWRGLGICLVCRFGGEFCRESGAASAGNALEFTGRISIFLLALPLIRELFSLWEGL